MKAFIATSATLESAAYRDCPDSSIYMIAGNGIFRIIRNRFITLPIEIEAIPDGVDLIHVASAAQGAHVINQVRNVLDVHPAARMSMEEAYKGVEFLRAVNDKYQGSEAYLMLVWNPTDGVRVRPITQTVSMARVEYDMKNLILNPGEMVIGDWHSHPGGGGQTGPSGTDDHDDWADTGFHIISNGLSTDPFDRIIANSYYCLAHGKSRIRLTPQHLIVHPNNSFPDFSDEIKHWIEKFVSKSGGASSTVCFPSTWQGASQTSTPTIEKKDRPSEVDADDFVRNATEMFFGRAT